MNNRFSASTIGVVAATMLVGLSLNGTRTAGQGPAPQFPRVADGRPDFSGIWQAHNTANWDLQTHVPRPMVAQRGLTNSGEWRGASARKDLTVLAAPVVALGSAGWVPAGLGVVEGEEIPYQPWAAARKQENFDNWLDRDPELKCYMPGVPRAMYLPRPFQIIHGTQKIMMIFEFATTQRTIHLDKVEAPPDDTYMGHSVGRWDGDTLVVDVRQLNSYTWFDRAGNFHSDALHVVERYTPMTPDAIHYEATIEDPKVFTRPWKISMPLYRRLEPNAQLLEFRCVQMVEETFLGHLRKEQLVERWEGKTMVIDVTRKIPPGEEAYDRQVSGNPPEAR